MNPMLTRDFLTKTIIFGTVLVTNLLADGLASFWLYESKQQYEQRAAAQTENLAFGVDQHVTNIIDKIDLVLQTTVEELERTGASNPGIGRAGLSSFAHFIDSHAAHLPELAAIGLVDQSGQLLLTTGSGAFSKANLADEAFFQRLRDSQATGLLISGPHDNVVAGRKTLLFARRYTDPTGNAAGMVLAVMPLDHLVQLMARYAQAPQATMALRDAEGGIIARFPVAGPGTAGAIGSTNSSPELRDAILSGVPAATLHSEQTADGVTRTFSLRRLDIAPIIAVAGVPESNYLAEWRRERTKTIAFLAALAAVTAIAGGLILRLLIVADRQSRRNRMFLERASDGVHVLDGSGILIEASDSFCAMLGYSREELIGQHASFWEAKTSRQQLDREFLPKLLDQSGRMTLESLHRRKDGTLIAVEVHASAVVTRRERFVYCSSRDITERNRLRAEIDSALKRFEAIFQDNPVALGMIDFNSGLYLDVNPAWELLTGFRRGEVIGRRSEDMGMWVELADRQSLFATLRPDGIVGPWEGQFRTADGRTGTCSIKGRLVSLASQRLFIWAIEDVTERKRVEVGLRLAASVFDFSHDGIMVSDAENKIIEINPAFSRITGYERDEVLGQDPILLSSDAQDAEFHAGVWESLANTGGWRGEIWYQRKSGDVYPALLSIAAIRDDHGDIQRYIAVFSDISQLKEHEAELHRVAHFDALTGLPNRRLLADRMHQAIARARRKDSSLAICFVDLDGFKEVNDSLGHEVGDRLLVAVSTFIQDVLRADDTLARLGGDEFVILLNDTGNDQKCFQVLDRVLASIVKAAEHIHAGIQLTGSIGVTIFPADDADADTLLRHADQAMYRAKESGKGRYHKFDPEHDRQVRASQEALQRLSIALEREEFVLHYQPKVNMVTGMVIGVEALVRWLHPERGVVPPGSFLPSVEGTDLEIALGDYVIDAALYQMARWKENGLQIPVSVNVSPNHIQRPQFTEQLRRILTRHGRVDPRDLQLEIVESSAIGDIKRATATLDACRKMGVSFALDDFGTGYSSLTYFRKLPIDILKVDQSFVRDMLNHPDDLGLVASVVHLAQAFSRPVIAEGVETEQHGELLVKLGCVLGQGYGISRPIPADLVEDWITYWQGSAGWRFPAPAE